MNKGKSVKKTDQYRQTLQALEDWDAFLLKESGLPGPRGNLELVQVVAEEGDETLFWRLLTFGPEQAPTNSPHEFLAVCGVVGLGRLLAEGQREVLATLRSCAADPRWRIREGVAMALQRWGERDMEALLQEMGAWSQGNLLEQRAAAAALCEPRLLGQAEQVKRVLQILDDITASLAPVGDRKRDDFKALKKGLGYCWSVAVAALPEEGKARMERWFSSSDPDINWIMRQNLKKNRLRRMDTTWVETWQARLNSGSSAVI